MVKVAADKHSMWISVQYNFYHPTAWGERMEIGQVEVGAGSYQIFQQFY